MKTTSVYRHFVTLVLGAMLFAPAMTSGQLLANELPAPALANGTCGNSGNCHTGT